MAGSILVVDTEPGVRETLADAFRAHGYKVALAGDGDEAMAALLGGDIEVALIEIFLRGDNGQEFLRRARKYNPSVEFIAIGLGLPDTMAVRLLEEGNFAFLAKPLDAEYTLATVMKAQQSRQLRLRNEALERVVKLRQALPVPLLAPSDESWLAPFRLAAPTQLPVLLYGEAGVEKSGTAFLIHDWSPRREDLFVPFSCSGELGAVEDELFGGADRKAPPGLLELTRDGTLLLQGVDRLTPEAQRRLAGIIERGQIPAPGGQSRRLSARLIATLTGRPEQAVESGQLTGELYEALARVVLELPPLRARTAALSVLVEQILAEQAARKRLSDEALELFRSYAWPGNLRQLRSVLAGLSRLPQTVIAPGDLVSSMALEVGSDKHHEDASLTLAEVERRHIMNVLDKNQGNKVRTARVLDINVKTLYNKIRLYGLGS